MFIEYTFLSVILQRIWLYDVFPYSKANSITNTRFQKPPKKELGVQYKDRYWSGTQQHLLSFDAWLARWFWPAHFKCICTTAACLRDSHPLVSHNFCRIWERSHGQGSILTCCAYITLNSTPGLVTCQTILHPEIRTLLTPLASGIHWCK